MYVIGTTNDTIFQYTLNTAWDVSSAVYASKSYNATNEETGPQGITFKPDGLKLYLVGSGTDAVREYDIDPPV